MPLPRPRVESFVVRFVQELPEEHRASAVPTWHGVILHVQSNEEKSFVKIADAVAFMSRFVTLDDSVNGQDSE
jgi:hypothetical protein